MGLAASQARLLTITSRLSSIELRQQAFANMKMRLAADQEKVSTKYTQALNNQTLTMDDKTLTYSALQTAGYNVIRTGDGTVATSQVTKPTTASKPSNNTVTSNSNEPPKRSVFSNDGSNYYRRPENAEDYLELVLGSGMARQEGDNLIFDENSPICNGYNDSTGLKFPMSVFEKMYNGTNSVAWDSIQKYMKNKGYTYDVNGIKNYEVQTESAQNSPAGYYRMPKNADEFARLMEQIGLGDSYSSSEHETLNMHPPVKGSDGSYKADIYGNANSPEYWYGRFESDSQFRDTVLGYLSDNGYELSEGMTDVFSATEPDESSMSESRPKTEGENLADMLKNSDFLIQGLLSGYLTLVKDGKMVSLSSCTDILTEFDKSDDARAEAEYNAEMAKLNRKEKQIDDQANRLDTEYKALTTEYSSVESILKDHTSKDFELFS